MECELAVGKFQEILKNELHDMEIISLLIVV